MINDATGTTEPKLRLVVPDNRPLAGALPGQAAHVTSDGEDITVRLSKDAANVLAGILARYDAMHHGSTDIALVESYDSDLWAHLTIDLLATRAMLGAAIQAATGEDTVYATPLGDAAAMLASARSRQADSRQLTFHGIDLLGHTSFTQMLGQAQRGDLQLVVDGTEVDELSVAPDEDGYGGTFTAVPAALDELGQL